MNVVLCHFNFKTYSFLYWQLNIHQKKKNTENLVGIERNTRNRRGKKKKYTPSAFKRNETEVEQTQQLLGLCM